LLSPQHWAQESKHQDNHHQGPKCITTADSVTLYWDNNRCIKTIELDPQGNNVGTVWSEPGYSIANSLIDHIVDNYQDLTFPADPLDIHNPELAQPDLDDDGIPWDHTGTISQDESSQTHSPSTDTMLVPWLSQGGSINMDDDHYENIHNTATQIHREIQRETSDSIQQALTTEANNQLDLMTWHIRLGHLQMSKIQRMAVTGMLPMNISKCRHPIMYAWYHCEESMAYQTSS
jgi:hypothetical protein